MQTAVPHSAAGVRYVCVGSEHVRIGLSVPDRLGHLTVYQGEWAYCSAARPAEAHEWTEIPATPLHQLRHATLQKLAVAEPARGESRSRSSAN